MTAPTDPVAAALAWADEPLLVVGDGELLNALAVARMHGGNLAAEVRRVRGCDDNCSCVTMSRHEWQRAYCEERLTREQAEAALAALREQRDILIQIADHYSWCQQCGDGPDCSDMEQLKSSGAWARREP